MTEKGCLLMTEDITPGGKNTEKLFCLRIRCVLGAWKTIKQQRPQ
jgi:hypothetical protein